MSKLNAEIYDALISAGADETKARSAAASVEELREENRMRSIEQKLTEHDGQFTLLKWMIGFNLAMTSAVLFLVIK